MATNATIVSTPYIWLPIKLLHPQTKDLVYGLNIDDNTGRGGLRLHLDNCIWCIRKTPQSVLHHLLHQDVGSVNFDAKFNGFDNTRCSTIPQFVVGNDHMIFLQLIIQVGSIYYHPLIISENFCWTLNGDTQKPQHILENNHFFIRFFVTFIPVYLTPCSIQLIIFFHVCSTERRWSGLRQEWPIVCVIGPPLWCQALACGDDKVLIK